VPSEVKPQKKRKRLKALASLATLFVGAAAAGPALAEVSSQGESTWGVYGIETGTQTDRIENQVFAIEQIGNTIYVGGKFQEARPNSNGSAVDQPFLAAFDADSGDFVSGFRPDVGGAVYALQSSPDGSRLFVGGEFTSIDGDTESKGLAALNPTTGAVDKTWRAKVTTSTGARGLVNSLTVSGDQLYVGGRFDRIGGGSRPLHSTDKVARVALDDGTADTSLDLTMTGGAVWGVAVSPDGNTIYLAGYHDSVNGDAAGGDFSVIDANTGVLDSTFSALSSPGNTGNTNRRYGQDIVAVGDKIFWGGSEHVVRVYDADTKKLVTQHSTDRGGDFQDLEVVGNRVYGSCHCYTNHYADWDWWSGREVPATVDTRPVQYIAAYSATTGAYIPEFVLDVSSAKSGIWAIHGDDNDCLWVGGDLSRMTTVAGNDRALGGFGQFCQGDGGDNRAPDATANLTQTRSEKAKIVISWTEAADNIAVAEYEISRDGAIVDTISAGKARYWYVDDGLTEATEYSYDIVAIDAAGNRGPAANIKAVTAGVVVGGDTTAPTEPGNLTATRIEDRKIVIRFDISTDNVSIDRYVIKRDGLEVGTITPTTANRHWYVDSGLELGTDYDYTVTAVDPSGNESTAAALTATTTGTTATSDQTAPSTPGNITQTREERVKLVIRWDASTDNVGVDHYRIVRDGVDIGNKPSSSSVRFWYTDTGLAEKTSFSYEVFAVDAAGNESAAATITAGTTGAPTDDKLASPTGLRTTRQTKERIVLNWTSVTGATEYVIERDGVDIGTKTSLWYTDTGLSAGTTYAYNVYAVDANGVRSDPAPISVDTLP